MAIKTIRALLVEDDGQDLIEYALLSGIIALAGVLLFPTIAARMGAAYTSWQSGAQTAWEPCAPAPGTCP